MAPYFGAKNGALKTSEKSISGAWNFRLALVLLLALAANSSLVGCQSESRFVTLRAALGVLASMLERLASVLVFIRDSNPRNRGGPAT